MSHEKDRYHLLVEHLPDPFAYHQIILDSDGNAVDYIFLNVNAAFEALFGIQRNNIIGKKVTAVLPDFPHSELNYIATCGKAALTGESVKFKQYFELLDGWFEITSYSDKEGYFASIFREIAPKKVETQLLRSLSKNMEKLLQLPIGELDYQMLVDEMQALSGAKYTYLNLYDDKRKKIIVKAASGINQAGFQLAEKLGIKLIGSEWEMDPDRAKTIKGGKLTRFRNLHQLSSKKIPDHIIFILEKMFHLGEGFIIEINYAGKGISDFVLLMSEGETVQNQAAVELFASQVGMLLIRKQAEKALKKSEEQYRFLIDNTPDFIYSLDREGRLTSINQSFCKNLGLEAHEIIGKYYTDLGFSEKMMREAKEVHQKVFSTGDAVETEVAFPVPDGTYRTYETILIPVLDEKGLVISIRGTARDVTARWQAEKALQESERRFQQLLNSLDEGVWSNSLPDGRRFYENPTFKKYFGQTYQDFLDNPDLWNKVIHPDDASEWNKLMMDIQKKGKRSGKFRIFRPDGAMRWIKARSWLVKDDAEIPVRMEGIFIDITEQTRAEEAVMESEERFRNIAEFSPLPISIIDIEGIYEYINPAFISVFGYTLEDVPIGREWFRKAHPDTKYRRKVIRQWFKELQSSIGDITEPSFFRVTCKDGSVKEIQFMPVIRMKNNKSLVIYQDVTEQKQVEEALKGAHKRLEEIFDFLPDATFVINYEGKVIAWNRAMEEMTKIPKDKMIGRGNYEYAIPFYNKQKPILIDLALLADSEFKKFKKEYDIIGWRGNSLYSETYVPYTYDGKGAFIWASASKLHDTDGSIIGAIETLRDITERKVYEEKLEYLSLHDQLTGLYNRTFFEEELKRLSGSREYPVTIISVDVDDLKLVNDSLGHATGDQLLIAAASVMKKSLRSSDILARVGGDEFNAILPRTDAKTGESIVARIRENMDYYNRGNLKFLLGLSLGLATAETPKTSFKDLYKQADDLMYRDKLYHRTRARTKTVQVLLSALGERDFISQGHANRLDEFCWKVGKRINLSSRQLEDLALLAQVHDLGKVGIPDRILFKRGPLSEKEWKIMRQHSEKGYKIALNSTDFSGIADLILKHHERWDGSGYPLKLKGEEIPVECRILAIVDAYDAIVYERPNNKTKSRKKATEELKKCAGTHFDPKLVKIFLSVLEQEAEG